MAITTKALQDFIDATKKQLAAITAQLAAITARLTKDEAMISSIQAAMKVPAGTSPAPLPLIFFTTFDDTNFATRRAVGRHWDQTIDGLTDAAVGIVGDGITGSGGWVSPNGAGDQILTDANYSGGTGGKGFRHWVGNGLNNGGGGIVINFTPSTEVWIRYYIRHQAGFAWGTGFGSGGKNMKTIYCNRNIPGTFYFGYFFNYIGGHVEQDAGFGTTSGNHLAFTSAEFPGTIVQRSWDDWQGGTTGDGTFHYLEIHVKMNTVTTNPGDGVFEFWADNVKLYSNSQVHFANTLPATFSNFAMGENHNDPESGSPTVDQYVDFDDVAISTSGHIGTYIP